ncbi:metal ABC transporter substrate-binding protein [Sulfurimonas sp.]
MKNLKTILVILVLVLAVVLLFISNTKKDVENNKPTVGVTTFALYDITKHIAGDSVNVLNILPFGVDPHSFEPTPKLMISIEKSSLIFYSGAGLEPWIANFDFKNHAVNISQYVKLRKLKHYEKEEHHSHINEVDPHYWLDFGNMKKASEVIKNKLTKLLPKNKALYQKNQKKYVAMLEELDKSYKSHLSQCKNDTVVVSHNALGYVADKYNFKVESLTGLSPEAEPSAQDINRIFKDIKDDGLDTIFFENFVNDRVIKSIAKDAKIKFDVFEPLGNITADEAKAGLTYEDIMKKNLKKLVEALKCQ